ncbi:MAG TPA: molybdopterin-dependent oxidoreductase, partial [Kofleriaceae bacterium]|nr:molybdopterin-dependent oxidoreductase [Kofleriaceae bacterium]
LRDGGVGARVARYRGAELALGTRPYVADLRRPDLLFGAVTLAAHPRARVLRIDTARAAAHPGVLAVATYRDVPGDRFYGLIKKDWPAFVAEGEEVRYVGDVLAAVAAVDQHTAREAAALVDVEYEPLPAVTSPAAALATGAPQVNPAYSNILSHTKIRRGDVDAALAASAHVVTGTWTTQRIEHLFLEPESAMVEPGERPGTFKLYSQGQGVFDDRRQCATFLGISEDDLAVELVPNGGAFGGKEDMSVQAQTALLCKLTGRPVLLGLTREQSIRMHPKRHPITMTYTVGCDAQGHLTAVKADMIGDTGAYASVGAKVLERAAGHACGPYRVGNVFVDALAVVTNNPPCGAMRGFGANQAAFAIEGCMDLLAEKVGLDGWEMRWRNAVEIGDTFASGQVYEKSVGIKKTLLAVKDAYYAARAAGRAVGIGCGLKNSGIGNGAVEWGKARLVVEPDGTVSLYNGYTEMGQGLLTVLSQFAAEVTGLSPSLFRPKVDSTFALGCGQTTGSRATLFGGNAVKSAAEKLRAALDAGQTLAQLAGEVFAADIKVDDTTPPEAKVDKVKTHTSFGFATQLCILDEQGKLERFVAAHDVGRAVNPALCEGQIEGSVHMGLGYALTEELPCEGGWPVTYKLRELGVLRARDMPPVEVLIIEDPEPEGPFGAKGVGEIGLVPTAGAVAGALAAFDGIRRYQLPMKDSPASRAMSVGKLKSKPTGAAGAAPAASDEP